MNQEDRIRMQFARVLHKALRQFEVEGCPEAFDMRVHIDQLVSKVEQAKAQALKDVGEYFEKRVLGEPPDNLGHPFVQVTGHEILALKQGKFPNE